MGDLKGEKRGKPWFYFEMPGTKSVPDLHGGSLAGVNLDKNKTAEGNEFRY